MNPFLKSFIEKTFETSGSALDLGAGNFRDVSFLKTHGWDCEGADLITGTDLEKPFLAKHKPFDLVYANYVLQKIENQTQFLETMFQNVKEGGWIFIHTFDKTDPNNLSKLTSATLKKMLAQQGFKKIKTKIFRFFDDVEAVHF